MRGRHAAELTHALARAMRAALAVRDRRLQQLRRQLDTLDLGRRLGAVRTRLVAADGRLQSAHGRAASSRRRPPARDAPAASTRSSPLAVLGRGYAVCWNADRTQALRDAATRPGDRSA